MLKVGVTGGHGSGKSAVCKVFYALNVPVYFSDERAKELMITNKKLLARISEEFGKEILGNNNSLNNQYLAGIVFNDMEKLAELNAIVHPVVIKDFNVWCKKFKGENYIVIESALLFESKLNETLDYVLGVYTPLELKMKRLLVKGDLTAKEITQRIELQMPEEEKMNLCDCIIVNDDRISIIEQVQELHAFLSAR